MLPMKCIRLPWMNMQVSIVPHVGMGDAMSIPAGADRKQFKSPA